MTTNARAGMIVGIAGSLAAIAALIVLFAPTQRSASAVAKVSIGADTSGETTERTSSQNLLESDGAGIVFVAAIPVVVAVLPLLAMRARSRNAFRRTLFAAVAVLGLFVIATGFSIGLLYVPALAALGAAAVVSTSRGPLVVSVRS